MGIMEFLDDHPKLCISGLASLVGVVLIGSCLYNFNPYSRRTLNPAGKQMEYPLPDNFKRMISVSSGGSEGDVLVTYESSDGKIISKEYNRGGLWETTINWNQPEFKSE
jgi:hypothetical protein